MQVVCPEAREALEECEDLARRMRAFLPARPPVELVTEFRLAAALVVGQLGRGEERVQETTDQH